LTINYQGARVLNDLANIKVLKTKMGLTKKELDLENSFLAM